MLPKGALTSYWITPVGKKVFALRPPTKIVDVSIGSDRPFPKGQWQAIIEAHGKIVARAVIRLR